MLNISGLNKGIVLDHIKAGKSLDIYYQLGLDKINCPVAINLINLEVLGYIDCNITINIIENDKIIEKKTLTLPNKLHNIIKCKNPRCISCSETYIEQIFYLSDKEKESYRCFYCDEDYSLY